jgi:peptidyl-Asp metalloendopeptidase
MYRIEQVTDGIQAVFELRQGLFPRESEPLTVSNLLRRTTDPPNEMRCGEDVVEMLVVYTQAVCKGASIGDMSDDCSALDHDIIHGRILQAESDTNAIFQNSQVGARVSIVHVALAEGFVEASSLLEDLLLLAGLDPISTIFGASTNLPLQSIHDLRDDHGADVVTLITRPSTTYPENQACGKAILMTDESAEFERYAFSVVPFDCVTGSNSFAHELGHVMGADHDPHSIRATSNIPNNLAFVKAQPLGDTKPWRTVMAENNDDCAKADPVDGCQRLPFFSNPDLTYDGSPMGASGANNSGVVSSTADTVVKFRPSLSCTDNE